MTRNSILSSAQVALVAGLLVLAVAGGASAGSLDASGTDATATTSDLVAGDTVILNATTNDTHTIEAIVANSTTPETAIVVNGTTFEKNTSMVEGSVGSEGTHWTGNISEQPLLDVPIDAGGNVSANLVVYNATNRSDELVNVTIYLESDGSYATTSDGSEVQQESTDDGFVADVLGSDDTPAAGTESSVGVTQNTTTVRYAPQNGSMQDAVGGEADAHDSDTPVWSVQVNYAGDHLPVVAAGQSTPSWLDESSDTYAEAQADGTVIVHNANASTAEDITISVVGAEKTNYLTQVDVMQSYDVSATQAYWKASIDYNTNPENVELAS